MDQNLLLHVAMIAGKEGGKAKPLKVRFYAVNLL